MKYLVIPCNIMSQKTPNPYWFDTLPDLKRVSRSKADIER